MQKKRNGIKIKKSKGKHLIVKSDNIAQEYSKYEKLRKKRLETKYKKIKILSSEKDFANINILKLLFVEFFSTFIVIPIILYIIYPTSVVKIYHFNKIVVIFEIIFFINSLIGYAVEYFRLRNIFDYFNIFHVTDYIDKEEFLIYRAKILNFPYRSALLFFIRFLIITIIAFIVSYFSTYSKQLTIYYKQISKNLITIYIPLFLFAALNSSLVFYYLMVSVTNPVFKIIKKVRIEAENTPFKINMFRFKTKVFLTFFLPAIFLAFLMLILGYNLISNFISSGQANYPILLRNKLNTIYIRLILLAFFSISSVTLIFSSYISNYIKNLIENIKKIEKGDFTETSEVVTTDELSAFAHILNVTTYSLSTVLNNVIKQSQNITKRVNKNFEIAQNLISLTEIQQNSIQRLSDTISTLLKSTSNIKELSSTSSNIISNALQIVQEQIEKFEESLQAMEEVEDISLKMIESLKLIIDISSHTKLLALNASIEASRVGESGKGFSVVASEIRKLAESSSNMSDQVANFIEVINNKVKKSLEGSKIIKETVLNIIKEISSIKEQVNEVMTETQTEANLADILKEISNDFTTVFNQNQQISGSIEQNAKDLVSESKQLVDLLKDFKIDVKGHIITNEEVEAIKEKLKISSEKKSLKKSKKKIKSKKKNANEDVNENINDDAIKEITAN